jgi:hypothetical protein
MIFQAIIFVVILYLVLRSLIPFIIFPGYLFDSPIKRTENLRKVAKRLMKTTKEQTLKNIFDYTFNNHGGIAGTIKKFTLLKNLFLNNPEELINEKVPLYCHSQNLIIKTLLVNTNQIKERDIKVKWQLGTDLGIHQYLLVEINNKFFKVDSFYNILQEVKNDK